VSIRELALQPGDDETVTEGGEVAERPAPKKRTNTNRWPWPPAPRK
jgi:hypothetical protein